LTGGDTVGARNLPASLLQTSRPEVPTLRAIGLCSHDN
jgi:hypothetical protein